MYMEDDFPPTEQTTKVMCVDVTTVSNTMIHTSVDLLLVFINAL